MTGPSPESVGAEAHAGTAVVVVVATDVVVTTGTVVVVVSGATAVVLVVDVGKQLSLVCVEGALNDRTLMIW
jgi:hypothetical protein